MHKSNTTTSHMTPNLPKRGRLRFFVFSGTWILSFHNQRQQGSSAGTSQSFCSFSWIKKRWNIGYCQMWCQTPPSCYSAGILQMPSETNSFTPLNLLMSLEFLRWTNLTWHSCRRVRPWWGSEKHAGGRGQCFNTSLRIIHLKIPWNSLYLLIMKTVVTVPIKE